jgi:hypothetical protein
MLIFIAMDGDNDSVLTARAINLSLQHLKVEAEQHCKKKKEVEAKVREAQSRQRGVPVCWGQESGMLSRGGPP